MAKAARKTDVGFLAAFACTEGVSNCTIQLSCLRGGGIMRLILEELELSLEKVNSTPAVEIFLLKVALTNSEVSKIH